jgi:glycosyltransferase involved in cell wall biosynthesis
LNITLIIPALNESHIDRLIAAVPDYGDSLCIIIIDDGSKKRLRGCDDDLRVSIVRHPYTIGNGAAVKAGIRAAGGDVLVFMDGDGQHDPADIGKLLEHIDTCDLVVGARTGSQQASWSRRWMNCIFNRLAAYVTDFRVEDLTSGFRAMRLETARNLLPFLPNGYSWPTTSTLVLLRSGLSVKYVPVNVQPRRHGRSRVRPLRDGVRFFLIIAKICTLYSPFRIFLPVSGFMFLLGATNYAYTYFTAGRFTNMSALMFSVAVIIFMMGLISEQISQISLLHQQVQSGEDDANRHPAHGPDHAG